MIFNTDEIKDAIHLKKPAILVGPRYSGQKEIYELIKSDLISQSVTDIIEIVISFSKLDPKNELKNGLKTSRYHADLGDYLRNSSLINDTNKNYLVFIRHIERLSQKKIHWLLRNCYNLTMNSSLLAELNITLIIEGTLTLDQLEPNRLSPFSLDLQFPRRINQNAYNIYLRSYFENVNLSEQAEQELWDITNGDHYFTHKLLNIFANASLEINTDMVLDAVNNYSFEGSYNDGLKWYLLDAIYELHNQRYEESLDALFFKVQDNWNNTTAKFKQLCVQGGLVTNYSRKIEFRCYALIKMIYRNSISRVREIETLINNEIIEELIDEPSKISFRQDIKLLRKSAYFGFIKNIVVGKARKIDQNKIEVSGNFNYENFIKVIWTMDTADWDEAYLLRYDVVKKPNEYDKIIRFYPAIKL